MTPAAQLLLLAEAVDAYGEIAPCAGRSWEQCFTEEGGVARLWFNDSKGSTHVVTREERA